MDLKSLAYTSLAALDLTASDLEAIHQTARELNALDGVTGLLIFNGTHFLQIIEGGEDSINELVERLRRDVRHSGFEIREEHKVTERAFPDWSMQMVRVSTDFVEARENMAGQLPSKLPGTVRERILQMTEAISGTVAF
ncbi:MAG: BLUF domain-containing protein [Pseudomonadota bacterium]|nr:BLUF domain-containing protein [Pseudomonadota bacterium]